MKIRKIISGGQTGVDRAALDFALEHKIESGGFVPKGRRAEDGKISEKYPHLVETATGNYAERTARNVQTADATLILSRGALAGGSRLTRQLAEKYRKPFLHIDLDKAEIAGAAEKTREWLASRNCETLNVAGPRASTDAQIYDLALEFLRRLFGHF